MAVTILTLFLDSVTVRYLWKSWKPVDGKRIPVRISEAFSVTEEEIVQSPRFLEVLVRLSAKHNDIDVAAQRFSLIYKKRQHLLGGSPKFEDEYFTGIAKETLRYADRTMREFKHMCAPQQSTKRARQDESDEGRASSSKRGKISEDGLV